MKDQKRLLNKWTVSYYKFMLSKFLNNVNASSKEESSEKMIAISTAALLIEAANADDNFTEEERKTINDILVKKFNLNAEELEEIISLANKKIEQSVSFYEFTNILNRQFSRDEKYEIIFRIFEVIFADSKLDSHEEYFIRTISTNLHLDHSDFIAAKIEIKKKLGII